MIYLFIIVVLLAICYVIFEPYLDIFEDYRGDPHIILWYNGKTERKYINLLGSQ